MNAPERRVPELDLFLVAENIRPDTGHRLSALGIYTSDDVIVDSKAAAQGLPIALSGLAFLFRFKNGSGDWQTSVEIRSAAGHEVGKGSMGVTSFNDGKKGVVVVSASPFEVKEWGEYTVAVKLEEHTFTQSFRLALGEI